jgi:hypothetical protein
MPLILTELHLSFHQVFDKNKCFNTKNPAEFYNLPD